MNGYGKTADASKYGKEMNPTPDKGEEDKETNTVNRKGKQSLRRTELVHIHAAQRDFMGDTPEVGAVLGLLSEKLDTGTALDNFSDKLKGYMEGKLDNEKDVMCVVTDIENPTKTFEEGKMPKYLYEE